MKLPNCIAASILAADFARLGEEVTQVIQAGVELIHIDVMDNHYVPNLTMGPMIVSALRDYGITADFDVHLMIKPVDSIIPAFAAAGANYISFHPEATEHPHRTIQLIRQHGCKPAIALNPATPLWHLDHVLSDLDMVLLMSVNPGFGGQQFIPESLKKLQAVRKAIDATGKSIRLEVDGGVNVENIAAISQAGADTFVAGTAIFKTADYSATIAAMRAALEG